MRSYVFFERSSLTSAQFVIVARDIDRVTVNAQGPFEVGHVLASYVITAVNGEAR